MALHAPDASWNPALSIGRLVVNGGIGIPGNLKYPARRPYV